MARRDPRGGKAKKAKRWRVIFSPVANLQVCVVEARTKKGEGDPCWVPTIKSALKRAGYPKEYTLEYCRAWMAGFFGDPVYSNHEATLKPGWCWMAGWMGRKGFYWIEEERRARPRL